MPAAAQALLYPDYDKLIVPLLLKVAFPTRGSSELTGFCGWMPQGRVHKDTTVWSTILAPERRLPT